MICMMLIRGGTVLWFSITEYGRVRLVLSETFSYLFLMHGMNLVVVFFQFVQITTTLAVSSGWHWLVRPRIGKRLLVCFQTSQKARLKKNRIKSCTYQAANEYVIFTGCRYNKQLYESTCIIINMAVISFHGPRISMSYSSLDNKLIWKYFTLFQETYSLKQA